MTLSICDYCKKKTSSKGITIVNIAQNPSNHVFCSQQCKKSWRNNVQRKKLEKINVWMIGKYLHRVYFIKKIVKKKGPNAQVSDFP